MHVCKPRQWSTMQCTSKMEKNINFPLAMPSANISCNVSPVCALDVVDEFKKSHKRQ